MQNTSSELSFLDMIHAKEELLTRKQAAHYLGIAASTLAIWHRLSAIIYPISK